MIFCASSRQMIASAEMVTIPASIASVMLSLIDSSSGVMRMSRVPVLAVDSDLERPHSVVAAVDFSESSLAAANYAVKMVAEPGKVFVVLVEPPLELLPKGFTYPDANGTDIDSRERLIRFAATMDKRGEVSIEPIVVNGRPVNALVEFAESVGADLIVAGSHVDVVSFHKIGNGLSDLV